MKIVETILGNARDGEWKSRLEGATIDRLQLDQWEAQKNRFRKTTHGGTELAVSLERASHLHDGDILVWDEQSRSAVVAHIELSDVMVIRLDGLVSDDRQVLLRTCFELGHALGNQHWPAVVKGTTVYVPLTVDRNVMSSVMKTHAFSGITYEFIAGTEVIPYLSPHESRRLFGGADSTPHTHLPGESHGHHHHHHHHS
jgi:urease accessory protein